MRTPNGHGVLDLVQASTRYTVDKVPANPDKPIPVRGPDARRILIPRAFVPREITKEMALIADPESKTLVPA